jgi:hypothetical protein
MKILEKFGLGLFFLFRTSVIILGWSMILYRRFPHPFEKLNDPFIAFCFGWVFFSVFFQLIRWMTNWMMKIEGRKNGKRKK